jgi:DNA-binding CsgD family transcriptional regulator
MSRSFPVTDVHRGPSTSSDPEVVDRGRNRVRDALEAIIEWARRALDCTDVSVVVYDPEVMLPVASASTEIVTRAKRDTSDLVARMLDDIAGFRELAHRPVPVARAGSELLAAIVDRRRRCWGALRLVRDAGRPFSEADEHAVAGNVRAWAEQLARAMMPGESAGLKTDAGSIWLDGTGTIIHATPSAQRWLQELAELHPPIASGALVAGLASRLLDSHSAAGATMRLRLPDGWITLHAEPVTVSDAGTGGVAVIIEAAHPGRVLPLAMAAFDLTDREAEITTWVLQGQNTKTISRGLGISQHTVQDHLKSVFAKVRVGSRGELSRQLVG